MYWNLETKAPNYLSRVLNSTPNILRAVATDNGRPKIFSGSFFVCATILVCAYFLQKAKRSSHFLRNDLFCNMLLLGVQNLQKGETEKILFSYPIWRSNF